MPAPFDIPRVSTELARGVSQLCALGLLTEGGRGQRAAGRLEVVRDALAQTESGALAGYGASDTRYALEVWRLVQRRFDGAQAAFLELNNADLAAFLDKIRKADFGPQVSSALARWLPPRIFISPQYTAQYLETLRPERHSSAAPTRPL